MALFQFRYDCLCRLHAFHLFTHCTCFIVHFTEVKMFSFFYFDFSLFRYSAIVKVFAILHTADDSLSGASICLPIWNVSCKSLIKRHHCRDKKRKSSIRPLMCMCRDALHNPLSILLKLKYYLFHFAFKIVIPCCCCFAARQPFHVCFYVRIVTLENLNFWFVKNNVKRVRERLKAKGTQKKNVFYYDHVKCSTHINHLYWVMCFQYLWLMCCCSWFCHKLNTLHKRIVHNFKWIIWKARASTTSNTSFVCMREIWNGEKVGTAIFYFGWCFNLHTNNSTLQRVFSLSLTLSVISRQQNKCFCWIFCFTHSAK